MGAFSCDASSQTDHKNYESGFTLLETIVAMTVLAITLTSILQIFVSGKKSGHVTDQYVHALILSQSLMAETLADNRFTSKSRSGQYGVLKWRVDVAPNNATQSGLYSHAQWQLFDVSVTIAWAPKRHLQLKTMKLGRYDG